MYKTTVIGVVIAGLVIWLMWTSSGSSQIEKSSQDDFQQSQKPCPSGNAQNNLLELYQSGAAIIRETTTLTLCTFDSTTKATTAMLDGIKIPKTSNFSFLSAWLKPEASMPSPVCEDLLTNSITVRFGAPPRNMPHIYKDEYTMGGSIKVSDWYFTNEDADQAQLSRAIWTVAYLDEYRAKVRARQHDFSYPTEPMFFAFDAHPYIISGKRGLVIGSESPWAEAMLLEYGAAMLTTVDFRSIPTEHPQIETYPAGAFTQSFLRGEYEPYDFLFSYSSLEHDGLGRYGDILNPNGDLLVMKRLQHLVKPGGYLFLGVPCCYDELVWNAHRIYGPIRLPALLAGWHPVGVYAESQFEMNMGANLTQPLWVLQNRWGCKET
jgi:hypothetical protein